MLESSIAMPGELIVTQGHEGSHMYFIFRGAARVMRETEQGSSLELAVLQSGQFFGEMALVDPASRKRTASVGELMKLLLKQSVFLTFAPPPAARSCDDFLRSV